MNGRCTNVRVENREETALDINSFTPVRMLADCVGTTEVLQYERGVSHGCSTCFASTPHTCWLNCNSSDTVGLTPQICKGNHDEPWRKSLGRNTTGEHEPFPYVAFLLSTAQAPCAFSRGR